VTSAGDGEATGFLDDERVEDARVDEGCRREMREDVLREERERVFMLRGDDGCWRSNGKQAKSALGASHRDKITAPRIRVRDLLLLRFTCSLSIESRCSMSTSYPYELLLSTIGGIDHEYKDQEHS
jgi:hypothetical protein